MIEKDVLEFIERDETKKEVLEAIELLDERYKNAIYLTNIEELSYEETANILGETLQNTKNLIHRGKKQLRKILLKKGFDNMNKAPKVIVLIIVLVFITTTVIYAITNFINNKKQATLTPIFTGEVSSIDLNTLWVGSFQLAWNELKNKIGEDVIFNEDNPSELEELNSGKFSADMISEDSYYIKVDKTTKNLKQEIEKDLEKRNWKNSLLNDIEFSKDLDSYTIYSILNKEFEFKIPFDRLPNKYFGDNEDIKVQYFGITTNSNIELFENFEILFFDDENNFAIKLLTTSNEELILLKSAETGSFDNLYKSIQEKIENYTGRKELQKGDTLSIPYIEIDTVINYDNLCGKTIKGSKSYIQSALQNVQFYLNEKGGHLTSEASIVNVYKLVYMYPLDFNFDSTFYIFMKEKNKDMPYMALKVDNTDILVEEK